MTPDERELARRFDELRRAESGQAPRFDATLAAARSRKPERRPTFVALAGAGAVTAVIALLWMRPSAPTPVANEIGAWRLPSDSLLETPGHALFEAPVLGTPPLEYLGGPEHDPSNHRSRPGVQLRFERSTRRA